MKKILVITAALVLFFTANVSAQSSTVDMTQTIVSSELDTTVKFSIYLPPNYDEAKEYPALYLFHGIRGHHRNWPVDMGMQETVDNEINNNNAAEMIIIMPDGLDAFYCNDYDERNLKYENFFINELIPYIEETYPVSSERGARAVAGLSMGGYGALFHALKRPEMFSSTYCMSGAILLGGNAPDLRAIINSKTEEERNNLPAMTLEIGQQDFLYDNNVEFHEFLNDLDIDHEYIVRPGTHNAEFWSACLPTAIQFVSDNLDL